ncbi:hypothetical protein [Spirosoma sp. KNUC1025]|uniref:hypothetical protein n=1 Tax=Spirosoma sp. KNUC1025 TaxID=2894082 RepID=UPI00386E5D76|nr:hypothetical protein LN737_29635 [Spirosoma sp. KNUC1025]
MFKTSLGALLPNKLDRTRELSHRIAASLPGRIEAEDYFAMQGIQSEPTVDTGGASTSPGSMPVTGWIIT